MITVTLYSREQCHLCDVARSDLDALQADFPHQLNVVDIDTSPDLQKLYGEQIPVIEAGPYRLKAPFTRQELAVTLGAAIDRQRQLDNLDDPKRIASQPAQPWTRSDSFSYWLSRHYLAVLNVFVIIYLGLPFLAPVLMKLGLTGPASLIYRGYGLVCHQLAFRSYFLFGEQAVYPREIVGLDGIKSFNEATGLSEGSSPERLQISRSYVGDENVGYKIALCQRDVAIYGSILLYGVLFAVLCRRLKPLPWYLWILIGIVPIALDGMSQLLSQPPLSLWTFRESTPFFRTLTGFLFGFMTAWFGYPMVEQTMSETRKMLAEKKIRSLNNTTPEQSPIDHQSDNQIDIAV